MRILKIVVVFWSFEPLERGVWGYYLPLIAFGTERLATILTEVLLTWKQLALNTKTTISFTASNGQYRLPNKLHDLFLSFLYLRRPKSGQNGSCPTCPSFNTGLPNLMYGVCTLFWGYRTFKTNGLFTEFKQRLESLHNPAKKDPLFLYLFYLFTKSGLSAK
jgi:hypothetical protein